MSFLDESLSDNACISEPLFQKNAASFWRTVFFLEAFVLFFIVTIAILSGRFDVWKLINFVGIVGIVLLPIFLLIAYSHIGYANKKMGNITFDGENISVCDPRCRHTYTAKFTDCRWLINKRIFATIPTNDLIGLGNSEVFLIVFPDSIKKVPNKPHSSPFEEPVIVTVGLTPETRLQWEQAVERLNVEAETRTILNRRGKVSLLSILH